jgi:hypothetical protein
MKLLQVMVAPVVFSVAVGAQTAPKSVAVPVTLDHNRTIIDVYVSLPEGTTKRVRAWVDNGNSDLWITEALATKLGLSLRGDPKPALAGKERAVEAPNRIEIGGMTIPLAGIKDAHAMLERESVAPGSSAEITIPSPVLRNYDVLFDYPNRQFTIGMPGSIPFAGESLKAIVNSENGLIQIPSKIHGEEHNLALDVGASVTLVSGELLAQWHKAQPAWPHMVGAIAAANMWGAAEETAWELLRLPTLEFGGTTLTNVVAASFPSRYLKWFEDRAGVATVGLVGANALLDDRVGIDYAHGSVYLARTNPRSAPDMDVVGLILHPEPDERYTILGVADYHGKPSVSGVEAGDVLLAVEGAPATGATMGQVWSLLGGTPGQTRSLTLERAGKRFTVEAPVHRFLAVKSKAAGKQK